MYNTIASLYSNPRSRVILNDKKKTDYFDCHIGVKQGDCLSPTLFAIFINDLATELKQSDIGIQFNYELDLNMLVNVLLYADDIVLIAADEQDLQSFIVIVEAWCKKWKV